MVRSRSRAVRRRLEDMATFRDLLAAAKQPLVILGGGGWDAKACADIKAFVEANHLPVTTAFRNQDLIDNRHANFVGDLGLGVNPPLGKRIKESDLIIADRSTSRRGDDRRLHHVRPAGAGAEDGARPCRRRRTGPRLSGDLADQQRHGASSPPPRRR